MNIQLDEEEYEQTNNALKGAAKKFGKAKVEVPKGSSQSVAMDDFRFEVDKLAELVETYTELLERDIVAFHEVANTMTAADYAAAAIYQAKTSGSFGSGEQSAGGSGKSGGVR